MSEVTQATDQSQTLEQTLNKTDLGHLIYEKRKVFFALLVAILVGVTGYFLWRQSQRSSDLNDSVKVFEFKNKVWSEAKTGKIAPTELVSQFEKLDSSVQSTPVMLPVFLDMGKFLYEKGEYSQAEIVLRKIAGTTKHPVGAFFVTMQLAVVLEKLNKVEEAMVLLEKLAQTKDGILPAKVNLELGRLYLLKGEKGKAQTQFDTVVSNYPNDEYAKLAKLYLSKLAQ